MNLDELEKEFWGDMREQPTRVRLARVVKALRDEFVTAAVSGVALAAQVNAGTAKPGAVERIADSVINEILASAGEGEAAGVDPAAESLQGRAPAAGFFVERTQELDAMFDAPTAGGEK